MTSLTNHDSSTVDLWHATSSSTRPGPIELRCESWLDASDLERAAMFRQPTSRNQHVIGKGMARRLLGNHQVKPHAIRFDAEVHGKPFVVEPEQAKRPFNVAHTDGLVMCGIGNDSHRWLGVDVERIGRRTDPALAQRYFSQPEIRYLNGLEGDQRRREAFLRIWTLKESFIKAIGTGLQTPLADFAFQDIESTLPTIRMLNPKLESDLRWTFFAIEPRPGFVGAIAVATTDRDPPAQLRLHSFDELLARDSVRDAADRGQSELRPEFPDGPTTNRSC